MLETRPIGRLMVVAVVILAMGWTVARCKAPAAAPVATIDKAPAKQADRLRIIDGMTTEGYFTQVGRNGEAMPRAWVTPKFSSGDFKDKENVMGAIYAYYFDGSQSSDSVALVDSKSGKEIGRYDLAGLHLD